MKRIDSPFLMREEAVQWLRSGKTIGFVPTMGALHEGHLSLIRRAKKENDAAVVSIFVNPTQFGPNEDYRRYPNNIERDLALLPPIGVDAVFIPEARDMFPERFQTRVDVEHLAKPLCGAFRPGHFRGVATIVMKLFQIVFPTRAYFGEKDFQQLLVVKQMVKDLNVTVEIVPCPIVREPDGLAMSSRNMYLSPDERRRALVLHQTLEEAGEKIKGGERQPAKIEGWMTGKIKNACAKIDYASVVGAENLRPIGTIRGNVLLAAAAWFGSARLIDNLRLEV